MTGDETAIYAKTNVKVMPEIHWQNVQVVSLHTESWDQLQDLCEQLRQWMDRRMQYFCPFFDIEDYVLVWSSKVNLLTESIGHDIQVTMICPM